MKFSNFIQSASKIQNQEKEQRSHQQNFMSGSNFPSAQRNNGSFLPTTMNQISSEKEQNHKQNFMSGSNFSSAQRNNDSFLPTTMNPISSVEVEDLKEELKLLKREIAQLKATQKNNDLDFEQKEVYTKTLQQKARNQDKRIGDLEDENFRLNQSLAEKDNYILELKSHILKSNQSYDDDAILGLRNENRKCSYIIEENNREIHQLKYVIEELSSFKRENSKLKYELSQKNKELEDIYSLYYEKMATNNYEKMSKNHSLSQYNDDPEYKPPSYTQSDRSFYNNDQNAYYD